MVIDIYSLNIDSIKIPVKNVRLPEFNPSPKLCLGMDIGGGDVSMYATFKVDKDAQLTLKEWGQFIHERQQESIDEEGCGAVICEYNLFLWEISDAFYEAHENAASY